MPTVWINNFGSTHGDWELTNLQSDYGHFSEFPAQVCEWMASLLLISPCLMDVWILNDGDGY